MSSKPLKFKPETLDDAEAQGAELLGRMAPVLAGMMLDSMRAYKSALADFTERMKTGGGDLSKVEISGWTRILLGHANAIKMHQNGMRIAQGKAFTFKDRRPRQEAE